MLTRDIHLPLPTHGSSQSLPDVSYETRSSLESEIEWVGMDQIEVPVRYKGQIYPAQVSAFVNLIQSEAKGIHMSRLYLKLQKDLADHDLNLEKLKEILQYFIESHQKLSDSARIRIEWPYMVKRKALVSGEEGWRTYPVWVEAQLSPQDWRVQWGAQVLYSSTCPCSAALSRQLIQQNFLQQFQDHKTLSTQQVAEWLLKEESIVATPHAQRSEARFSVDVDCKKVKDFDVLNLINEVESTLATPVQTAVKRQDEQQFALLNGQNLMFCEDAARRLKHYFESHSEILGYSAEVKHLESLHPHNAVARIYKR